MGNLEIVSRRVGAPNSRTPNLVEWRVESNASPCPVRVPLADNEVIQLYQSGRTLRQVADAFAIGVDRVLKVLKRNHIPRRPRGNGPGAPSARHFQIAAVYQSGKTLEATGKIFGITRERVRQVLVKVGVPSRRVARFSSALGDRVARLYQRGQTIEAAAAAVGVSAFTARNMLVERGIERRTGASGANLRPLIRKRHEAMVRLYQRGKTFKEVANAFQTSTTSVQRVLNRLGIERRGRGGRARAKNGSSNHVAHRADHFEDVSA